MEAPGRTFRPSLRSAITAQSGRAPMEVPRNYFGSQPVTVYYGTLKAEVWDPLNYTDDRVLSPSCYLLALTVRISNTKRLVQCSMIKVPSHLFPLRLGLVWSRWLRDGQIQMYVRDGRGKEGKEAGHEQHGLSQHCRNGELVHHLWSGKTELATELIHGAHTKLGANRTSFRE